MLTKLRENISGKRADELAAEISETRKMSDENADEIALLKQEIAKISSGITELSQQQKQLQKSSEESAKKASELRSELEESIKAVKVVSSNIQNNLLRKMTDEMNALTTEISAKLGGSEKLKQELHDTATAVKDELASLKSEITRLQTISSKIKADDFELTKFAGNLKQADDEKLKLMRQVDSLQRLVSSLRRKMH